MPSAPRTARSVARAELTRAILDRAGEQLAEVGPAALSLRQVSRDLGMASSALYRYFPSRDALLTALIVEGYDDLGARVEAAEATAGTGSAGAGTTTGTGSAGDAEGLVRRWRSVAHAVRDWARDEPHRYALLYGSPVPGYAAPDDTVVPAGRVTGAVLRVVVDAQQLGLRPARVVPLTARQEAALAPVAAATDPPLDPVVAARATEVFGSLLGAVSLELFGHLHRGVLDYDAHFDHVVDLLGADLGLLPSG